jgi:hypothetical protein
MANTAQTYINAFMYCRMKTCAILTHHLIHEPPRHVIATNRPLGQRVYGHGLHLRAVSEGVRPVIEARVTYLCVWVREREGQRERESESRRACMNRTCVYRR